MGANLALQTAIFRSGDLPEGMRQFLLAENVEGVGKAGDVITMSITPADTSDQLAVIDSYISGYKPFQFCADIVSPVVTVAKEKGKRIDRAKESAFEVVETAVGRQGHINELQDASTRVDYTTQEHALATYIPWASEAEALDQYDVRRASTQMLADKILLSREVRVFNFLTTLNNWAATNRTSLTANFKWDNGSTKNPRKDLHDRITVSGQPVTGIAMNPDVAFWFLSDAEVRAYLRQHHGDNAPPADLARAADTQGYTKFEIFGYPTIHVCPAKKLVAGNLTYVLGDDVVLFSRPPGDMPVDMFSVASSLTFRHRGKSGVGWVTNEYIPNGRGLNGGRMIETGFGETTFMGSNIAGGLIKDVLS
jgi:hypothetical protein